MPRPRSTRKDLPQGLYPTEDGGFRLTLPDGSRRRLGRISRDDAVAAWVRAWGREVEPAQAGTFAELLDAFERLALPGKGERTRQEYRRQIPKLRARWGSLRYAQSEADAARDRACMRPGLFMRYLDGFAEGQRGISQARHDVRLVSTVFAWAIARDYTLWNPVRGVQIGKAPPRRVLVDDGAFEAVLEQLQRSAPSVALASRLRRLTGMRSTDARLLTLSQVRAAELDVEQSKTGTRQAWILSPGVREILDAASVLRASRRRAVASIYVFPSRSGRPYTEQAFSRAWTRAARAAGVESQARDLRKTAIDEARSLGANATDFAGHQDPRTTAEHYLVSPVSVVPLDMLRKKK